ncbi:MAG: carboxymuconolactone decarboxylase family protein [Ginsengibacter sp.]
MVNNRISLETIPMPLLEGMMKIEHYLKNCGVDRKLLELVKYRVSQINGCGYCLDMHHKEAILLGESEQRLHGLAAWRESPYYSPTERDVLAYAEVLTLTQGHAVEDSLFESLRAYFSLEEVIVLTLAITQINSWNRISKAFGSVPGSYEAKKSE